MRRYILITLAALMCLSACKTQRMGEPAMPHSMLLQEVREQTPLADDLLGRKCADDAKQWFHDAPAKDGHHAILLRSWSHDNGSVGQCYAQVETYFRNGTAPSWGHELSVWNVNRDSRIADLAEERYTPTVASPNPKSKVIVCEVYGKPCATPEEFSSLTEPYLASK